MNLTIGTFNVNNLFMRANAMELEGFSKKGAKVLADVKRLNELLEESDYSGVQSQILGILKTYVQGKKEDKGWLEINEVKQKLFTQKKDGSLELKAKGRGDWLGWVRLKESPVEEISTENTARVIQATKADILCVVEVEDRIALDKFNQGLLKRFNCNYEHAMVIDGNDERGIDVGLLSKYEIMSMKSHVDDNYTDKKGNPQHIFSRDCPEYAIRLPNGQRLTILCNHLKSMGYGAQSDNDEKRTRQAERVKEILQDYNLAQDLVVVAGDFNEKPQSPTLQSLLTIPDLSEVFSSPTFSGPRWTYREGKDVQLDYLLVSKPLFDSLQRVEVERRGIFKKGNQPFPEVTDIVSQASDHAALYAEFQI